MAASLQGKTAVVTGGGTGIGLGIAKALADEGSRVVIAGRRDDVLREAAAAHGDGQPLLCHPVDVADRESVAALFGWAEEQLGQIDILVNSAGTNIRDRTMETMSPDDWDSVMAINATGAYNALAAVLPAMKRRGDGLVINISSISGLRATTLGGIAYSASKFAMAALTTACALEYGTSGVRLTNIYPGEVNTPILEKRPKKVSDEHKATMLLPEDLGAAVVMIACLPPRAHVPELVIKPTVQKFA